MAAHDPLIGAVGTHALDGHIECRDYLVVLRVLAADQHMQAVGPGLQRQARGQAVEVAVEGANAGRVFGPVLVQGEGFDRALDVVPARDVEQQGDGLKRRGLGTWQQLDALLADPKGFQLLLTDFNMPGMSGLEVAKAALAINPLLPVAVASGYITDELQAEAKAAGVREVVFKTDAVEAFCEVVARLVRSEPA